MEVASGQQREHAQHRPDRCLTSVSGFWWSGSGAVADWLIDSGRFKRPDGGELRAMRGLAHLLELATGQAWQGERFARHQLYPDPGEESRFFQRSLVSGGLLRPTAARVHDRYRMRREKGLPHRDPEALGRRLTRALKQDYRSDTTYQHRLRRVLDALAMTDQANGGHPRLKTTVSSFVAHFHDLWADRDHVPLFDNMVPAGRPRLLELVDAPTFQKRVVFFVQRDPRDQFTEIARKRGPRSTRPWAVRDFIRQYRDGVKRAADCSGRLTDAGAQGGLLWFEDFVHDAGLRRQIAQRLEETLPFQGHNGRGQDSRFDPAESAQNIGIWTEAPDLRRPLRKIAHELEEHLHPLAA